MGIHPDNDNAFFNAHLDRFWRQLAKGLTSRRSRAFQKNDNSFVEQKNSSLVRAHLGFDRLDTIEQTSRLNQLYGRMWIYCNLFQPVIWLEDEIITRLDNGRSRVRRRYDEARTPLDRLDRLHKETNPRQLRAEIGRRLDDLQRLPAAREGQRQNTYQTLFTGSNQRRKGQGGSAILSL